jgi:hypothetical protein
VEMWRKRLSNATLLIDEGVNIEGVHTWGSPITRVDGTFWDSDEAEGDALYSKVPTDPTVDILITRGSLLGSWMEDRAALDSVGLSFSLASSPARLRTRVQRLRGRTHSPYLARECCRARRQLCTLAGRRKPEPACWVSRISLLYDAFGRRRKNGYLDPKDAQITHLDLIVWSSGPGVGGSNPLRASLFAAKGNRFRNSLSASASLDRRHARSVRTFCSSSRADLADLLCPVSRRSDFNAQQAHQPNVPVRRPCWASRPIRVPSFTLPRTTPGPGSTTDWALSVSPFKCPCTGASGRLRNPKSPSARGQKFENRPLGPTILRSKSIIASSIMEPFFSYRRRRDGPKLCPELKM